MKKILFTTLLMLLLCPCAFAQSSGSTQGRERAMTLTGAVYDINGSVIVDAMMVAVDGNGKKYASTTSDEGVYKIQLPLAVYKIGVSAPGFCSKKVEDFIVVNSTHGKMSLDFVLEVAPASNGLPCNQENIIEEQPKSKPKKKSKPIA